MTRLRDVRLSPLGWVAVATVATGVLRFTAALQVRTPIYYPDEYLNTAISRGFAAGTFGQFRDGSAPWTYTSYFVPLLHAPLWWLDDVELAYRLAQGLGVVAFASSAFAAYLLARRVGVGTTGSALVATLALLVPSGAFTTTLLAEPYTYPLFLLAVLLSVDRLATSSPLRQVPVVAATAGLCFVGGLQFLFFGVAYAVAWLLVSQTREELLRRLTLLSGVTGAPVVLLLVSGNGRYLEFLYASAAAVDYPIGGLAAAVGINSFVLAVGAGWLLIPGAVLGLFSLARAPDARSRAYGLLAACLLGAMVLEAALWTANGQGVYERFVFYGGPLLAIGFARWAAQRPTGRSVYAALAYTLAVTAVLLPVAEPLSSDDHAPALMGLSFVALADAIGPTAWAPALALLAIGLGLGRSRRARSVWAGTGAFCLVTSIGSSVALVRTTWEADSPPRIDAPAESAFLSWSGSDAFFLQKTLFWNPELARVVVVGGGGSPDPFPVQEARFTASGSLVSADGSGIRPPFVIGPDVLAVGGDSPRTGDRRLVLLRKEASVLAFGWYRELGRLGSSGQIFVAGSRHRGVTVRLRSPDEPRRVRLRCVTGFDRTVDAGARPVEIELPTRVGSPLECRFATIRGTLQEVRGNLVGPEGTLTATHR